MSGRGPCMIHCPRTRSGAAKVAVAAVAAAVAAYVLWQVAVVLAVAAAGVVVIVAALAWASRLLRDRLSIMHWESVQAAAKPRRSNVVRAELEAPRRAIEQRREAVYLITDARERSVR